jgi:hypothetical protein
MCAIRASGSAGHMPYAAGIRPGESSEVAAVSAASARSFPRCSGSSAAAWHVCAVGLPPEFHAGSATLERLEQGTRGAAA